MISPLPLQMPPPGLAGGGGVGAPRGLSHTDKNVMLPMKASVEGVRLLLKVEVGVGGTLPIIAMPVPLAPQLVIMRLWRQEIGMGMEVGRGRHFHLLLLLLCSCRVSLVWNA